MWRGYNPMETKHRLCRACERNFGTAAILDEAQDTHDEFILPPYIQLEIREVCIPCGLSFPVVGSEYATHNKDIKHLRKQAIWDSATKDMKCTICERVLEVNRRPKAQRAPKPVLKCDVCSVAFRSRAEETQHLATAKHAKNILKTDSSPPSQTNLVS